MVSLETALNMLLAGAVLGMLFGILLGKERGE